MKKLKIAAIAFLILLAAGIALFFYGLHVFERTFLIPPTIIEANELTLQLENDVFMYIVGVTLRGPDLPKNARNIFACRENHMDDCYYLAFDLEESEAQAFVEELAGVPISKFSNGIPSKSMSKVFFEGPYDISKRKRIAHPRWKPSAIQNGKYFEEDHRCIAIDLDKNRIFVCSM